MRLLAVIARREGGWTSVWVLVVGALTVISAPAYASTYATAADRRAAVVLAQRDAATTLLYGRLPDPGTPAQLFAWEVGAFTTILVAVAAVLAAVRVTRATEDSGMFELIRSCGVTRSAPHLAAVAWLFMVGVALGAAAGGGILATAVPGATTAGAVAYGLIVAATFVLVASTTLVVAQVAPSTVAARRAAMLLVGVALVLRAYADALDVPALSVLSPLGLRGSVRPFTDDRFLPLLVALLAAGGLVAVAVGLATARDPGTGLVRGRDRTSNHLRVSSSLGLTSRLAVGSVLTWAVAVASTTGLLTAMGSTVVASARAHRLDGGFLAEQLGDSDPADAYFGYVGTVAGIAVSVLALLIVLGAARQERDGLLEHLRSTGVRRWAPLAAHAGVAALASLVVLSAAGGAAAVVAPRAIGGTAAAPHAWQQLVGQWPGVVALVGGGALCTGVSPRINGLAWVPFAASAALVLVGGLVGVPASIVRLGVFGHAPDAWGSASAFAAAGALAVVGALATAVGAAAAAQRSLVVG